MEEIVLQYTGEFKGRFLEATFGDGEHLRVILRDGKGKEKNIFTGKEFSDEEFQERITGNSPK